MTQLGISILIYPLLLSYIILLNPCLVLSYTINTYQIKDLENTDTDFISETTQWTHSALETGITNSYSVCNNIYLLGGHSILVNDSINGAYFQRTFEDLPPHRKIYFTFDLWLIDSWDADDSAWVELDSTSIEILRIGSMNPYPQTTLLCGTTNPELGKVRIFGSVSHTAPSVTFRLKGKTDQNSFDESFGFRNVDLLFSSNSYPQADQSCATFSLGNIGTTDCGCPEGFYKLPSGSCAPCHCGCASCFGPSEKQCFQCKSSYPFNERKCSSIDSFCKTCDASDDGIVDADDICKDCQEMNIEYVQETPKGYRYTMTLLPASCDLDESFVQNNLHGTPSPGGLSLVFSFRITKLSANTYQMDLDLDSSVYQEAVLDISLHYLKALITVPKRFMPSPELQQIAENVPLLQTMIQATLGASLGGSMLIGASGAIWSLIGFQQFVTYFRYVNIDYPFQVDLFFSLADAISWDLLPDPLEATLSLIDQDILEEREIFAEEQLPPRKFVKNSTSSSFIDNGGVIIVVNIILLLILTLTLLIKSIKSLRNNKILKFIKINLKWNGIARTFLENGIPLSLAIFLQLRTLSFETRYLAISSTFTLISCVYFLAISIFFIRSMIIRKNPHLEKSLVRNIFGTLYEGLVLENTPGKYYHLIILFRGVLLTLLVTFIETVPLFQIFVNVGFIYLMLKRISFTDRNLTFLNRLKETLLLIAEVCIACLYVQVNSGLYYEALGWTIVGSLGLIYILELGYIILMQLLNIKVIAMKIVNAFRAVIACFTTPTKDQPARPVGPVRQIGTKTRKKYIRKERAPSINGRQSKT